MKLLIDGQALASTSSLRGIGRYALSLTRALVASSGAHQVEVLLGAGAEPNRLLQARTALERVLPAGAVHVFDAAWPWHSTDEERYRPAAEAAAGAAVESLDADALLVLSAFERDDEAVLHVGSRTTDPPTAAVLYDLIPALDPSSYLMGPEEESYWRRCEQLARCDGLLAISAHSAGQARQVLGDRCPPVTTVWGGPYPSGAFPEVEPMDDLPGPGVPDRFLLSVGGDHPRKNLDRLVAAWGRVPADVRRERALVVACRLHPGTVRRLDRLARRVGLRRGELVLTGRVSERTLQRLYTGAEAFVFPSTEEGLGMPPLEAMAAGCPTLLARGSSLSELTDDSAAFFDPLSVTDMASAITRVLTDAAARAALRETAARSTAAFTWDAAARRAWTALEELRASSRRVPAGPGQVIRLSDRAGVTALAATPAPVLLDAPLSRGPVGVLGLPVEARAALAPATALLAPSPQAATEALRQGILDQPLLRHESELARVAVHDFHASLGERLALLELDAETGRAVVTAARRAPRWTLERPRPVWLLLADQPVDVAVQEAADRAGVDLVVAAPTAAGLAAQADVVLAPAAAVPALTAALLDARCRGGHVVALHGRESALHTPPWCADGVLDGSIDHPAAWRAHLAAAAPGSRTTGWPWRSSE